MANSKAIINGYNPKNAEDMQDVLKDISSSMFDVMLLEEMYIHFGY